MRSRAWRLVAAGGKRQEVDRLESWRLLAACSRVAAPCLGGCSRVAACCLLLARVSPPRARALFWGLYFLCRLLIWWVGVDGRTGGR
jgi:hypothetical protein